MNFVFGGRYILEGKELEFYLKKIQRKKGKGAGA
jgi:small subunit ribosomal protein S8e